MRVGLLSRITRNGWKSSPFLKSYSSPLHRCSSSPHSTLSPSHLWKISSRSGTIQTGSILTATSISKIPFMISNRRLSHSFTSLNHWRRSIFTRFTTDGVLIGLIMANVAVFMLWKVADTQFMVQNFMMSVDNLTSGRLHTLITYAFSHSSAFHLFTNMIRLYFFGKSIGESFGAQYLLKLYVGGAVVGSIFCLAFYVYMAEKHPVLKNVETQGIVSPLRIYGLGASASVNTIMLLNIFLFPNLLIPMPRILPAIIISICDSVRVWQSYNLYLISGLDGSGAAHLGGAGVAVFAWLRSRKGRF